MRHTDRDVAEDAKPLHLGPLCMMTGWLMSQKSFVTLLAITMATPK